MNIKKDIARICNEGAKMLDINLEFSDDMINHDNNYVGKNMVLPQKRELKR